MATFSYIAKDGSQKTIEAADAASAMKSAPDIQLHSGVQAVEASTPPQAPIPAPAPSVPAPKAPTGQNPPAPSSLPANPTQAAPQSPDTPNTQPQPSAYTVKPGDTLAAIAAANGTNIQALMAANPSITNPGSIKSGSSLVLPPKKTLPTTATPLSQISKAVYGAVSKVPNQNDVGAVTAAGASAIATVATPDPVSAAIAPIVAQLQGAVAAIMAPGPTYTSLASEYQNLVSSSGLQGINLEMVNLQNVMNGSVDDIRNEITAAGGFATESGVQALATSRNNVLLKQYNALAAQQAVAQDYVNNTMQYAAQDQATQQNQQQLALTKINDATGILDQMATLQTTIVSNAQKQYDGVVTQVGYQGLAKIVAGNPYQQSLAEMALGLPQGTLSDADKVAQLQTFKQQQLAQSQQKIILQYGAPPAPGDNSGTGSGSASTTVQKVLGVPDMSIPLSQAIGQYGADGIANALIQNEGSSPAGVSNNPGNIKYVGAPGQVDSGVPATDGGTFASYHTPAAGKQAVADLVTAAASGKNSAYGDSPTLDSFVGTYTNTGTQSVGDTGSNNSITKATGLSIQAFNYLTQGVSSMSRMPVAQRNQITAEAQKFLDKNGIDVSTFQSRYEAYNQTLQGNIMRTNAAQIQENELQGTIGNLQDVISASDLGKIKVANLADLFTKGQTNDPVATKYSTFLLSLQNELAGYNAAARGNLSASGGPSPDQSDMEEAAKVISNGISTGSLQGFKDAITSQQAKMGKVLNSSVDAANKSVWDLFGVGSLYTPSTPHPDNTSAHSSSLVDSVLTASGFTYQQAVDSVPPGQIGIIRNGQFGSVPTSEYDPSTDTKI